jgi:hypothetical protein
MSETLNTQPKTKSARSAASDGKVLAQVEKWMTMIREINREQVKS